MRSQPQKAKYRIKESKQNIHVCEIKLQLKTVQEQQQPKMQTTDLSPKIQEKH